MKFDCPICKQALDADNKLAGQEMQCPACSRYILVPSSSHAMPVARKKDSDASSPAPPGTGPSSPSGSRPVRIVDINMPFMSMVLFLVKLSLAAIPAMIILGLVYLLFGMIFLGGCAAFFSSTF